ncbi:TIGR01244 family sulfur transferase [Aquincola tertiaricarbonis]|uniref:TIGR01244 family sulfur transferase n=1 Tax=Aquincola tertiaricarbonis TaxID=391953 RepID=A0ABY4SIE2_AQUTE|nr:TIGR01244 family sulfur transferase [Aquincola tertiaricarbonis]URI11697.1 TIGR01244 family sulfur transferase [Aquincola tertiaricarbonis]
MSLPLNQIAADVCVAPQLTPEAMADAAAAGFRSVVNNRPDHEGGPDQPTSAQIEAAARAAGLEYRYLPVQGGYQSPEEIAQFALLLEELPRPLLAFCRSGARSTRLYMQALQSS